MKLEIEINEKRITELVELEIAKRIVTKYSGENSDANYGVKTGVEKAIKEYIYAKKDEIIDKVIQRASVEIVRKGLPKFLTDLGTKS